MMKLTKLYVLLPLILMAGDLIQASELNDQLLRDSYVSEIDNQERDYFVYLPRNYSADTAKKWPLLFFLHGNGERGDGKSELDFVLHHGPLYEAWVQKRDLPFIIVAPQLHMFGQDKLGIDYIDNRKFEDIPQRLATGVPPRPVEFESQQKMKAEWAWSFWPRLAPLVPPVGWDLVEQDLLGIVKAATQKYNVDSNRLYLSGISYGGFGTWYMASKHPELFAAIAPVVGWVHPDQVAPIAERQLPLWVFAGGRDSAVNLRYFYAGLNKLEQSGHKDVRFTIHQDMEHDTWRRVYEGNDLYQWLLSNKLAE
ncbi:MAG: prolyl oligopeptidase family serine peptidase [Arenicella sp.]|nr:prolyl oligopeptidase family serine peptidase [Arenicella sp.]